MRDSILNPLFSSLSSIKGVGEKSANLLLKLGISKPVHLLWHLPQGIILRKFYNNLNDVNTNSLSTIKVRVLNHKFSTVKFKKLPHKIICEDSNGTKLTIIYFNGYKDYLEKAYPIGEDIFVSGKILLYKNDWQITHPDYVSFKKEDIPEFEKRYPLTEGLSNRQLQKWINQVLLDLPDLEEWNVKSLHTLDWLSFTDSLNKIHKAESELDFAPTSQYCRRLAYDELLAEQLALVLYRRHHGIKKGFKIKTSGNLVNTLIANLPFELTQSQKSSLDEIEQDFQSGNQMLRLLQGDVGSGKTLVGLISALKVIENGGQVAMMAPTDILARQHYNTIKNYLSKMDIKVELLSGKDGVKKKRETIEKLSLGHIDIVIGTHALFQDGVVFKKLEFVIIDEQHKFGVFQRIKLTEKGDNPHLLLMTATPIPRTLVLAKYGDIDITVIKEKPAGRKPVDTRIVSQEHIKEVVEGLARVLAKGEKIYWVCPIIDESEVLDIVSAEDRYSYLKKHLPKDEILLVHGKMTVEDREKILQQFKDNKGGSILVATTVIEVGIDIPDSNIMIIDQAERFGLSQLHQLRGRVGRGEKEGICILLYGKEIGELGIARLKIMRSTNDGFVISEEDLKLRGGGDTFGDSSRVRQSGAQNFKIANLFYHADLLEKAIYEAKDILNKDEFLSSERGKKLQTLLYLFEKQDELITRLGG